MAGQRKVGNPLKSETEAFRWLVVIAAGAATVIVVALLLGSAVGAIWALLLVVAGITYARRGLRAPAAGEIPTRGDDGRYRVLVLANQTVRSTALIQAALAATAERESEILLVVPALVSGAGAGGDGQVDGATELARQRMELTLIDLREQGRRVRGSLNTSEPNRALREALSDFPADEVIVSTLPRDRSHWLEGGVVERARIELNIPVRHVIGED